MGLTGSYLITSKNLDSLFNSLINAKAPERLTLKFLSDLGFSSSNDRLYIGIIKSLGLIDENSQPTKRYYEFLDQSLSKKIIALGVQEAYEDLFNIRIDAQNMTVEEVKNKLKTLTQGQKSDKTISLMAMTFKALCDYAEWESSSNNKAKRESISIPIPNPSTLPNQETLTSEDHKQQQNNPKMDLLYNIQIHLPETTNMSVYDAIFQSLRKHLF